MATAQHVRMREFLHAQNRFDCTPGIINVCFTGDPRLPNVRRKQDDMVGTASIVPCVVVEHHDLFLFFGCFCSRFSSTHTSAQGRKHILFAQRYRTQD